MFGSVAIISRTSSSSSLDDCELMEIGLVSCPWFNLRLFDGRLMVWWILLVVVVVVDINEGGGGGGGNIPLLEGTFFSRCVAVVWG